MELRLREIRKKKNLNAIDIARQVGVTPASYYRYEKGEQTLSADVLYRLAEAMGVSADSIIGLIDDDEKEDEKKEGPIDLKAILSDQEKIFWGSFPMTKEDIEELRKYAEFIIWKKIGT